MGTFLTSFNVPGPSAEKEAKTPGVVADILACLPAVTTGGVKALDKTVAADNSPNKVDKASTGGGTVHIPSKVTGPNAGKLPAEEDKAESVKEHTVKVEGKPTSFADYARVDVPVEDVNIAAVDNENTFVDHTGPDTGFKSAESHKNEPVGVKIAARNGFTGAPETKLPVNGIP